MKRYMLISVCDRELSYNFSETLEDAQKKMKEEVNKACDDELEEFLEDKSAEINEMSAWVNDGVNHCSFDWWIVDLVKENK